MKLSLAAAPAVLIAVASAALPATAQAPGPSLITNKLCYQEKEQIGVRVDRFTPNGQVDYSVDGRAVAAGPVDANGTYTGGGPTLVAPVVDPSRERPFTLTASDRSTGRRATVGRLSTVFDVSVRPRTGSPYSVRRIRARGFTGRGTLYMHVRRGHRVRNVRLGRLRGLCGTLSLRKRIFGRHAGRGRYAVQFDTSRRFRRHVIPRVVIRFEVFRVFRSSVAGASASRSAAGATTRVPR